MVIRRIAVAGGAGDLILPDGSNTGEGVDGARRRAVFGRLVLTTLTGWPNWCPASPSHRTTVRDRSRTPGAGRRRRFECPVKGERHDPRPAGLPGQHPGGSNFGHDRTGTAPRGL